MSLTVEKKKVQMMTKKKIMLTIASIDNPYTISSKELAVCLVALPRKYVNEGFALG